MAIVVISLLSCFAEVEFRAKIKNLFSNRRRRNGKPTQAQAHSPHRTLGWQRQTGGFLLPQGLRLFSGWVRRSRDRRARANFLRHVARQGEHGAHLALDLGPRCRRIYEETRRRRER